MKLKKNGAIDSASWERVKPADNDVIDAMATSLLRLSSACSEWTAARKALDEAVADFVNRGNDIAKTMQADSNGMRKELARRKDEHGAYSAAVFDKCREVEAIHPEIAGQTVALMKYATGEVDIGQAIEYPVGLTIRKFEPAITKANAEKARAFRPAMRSLPNTEAITMPSGTDGDASCVLTRFVAAQKRYETACASMADALKAYNDCRARLAKEAEAEAESVKAAISSQTDCGA